MCVYIYIHTYIYTYITRHQTTRHDRTILNNRHRIVLPVIYHVSCVHTHVTNSYCAVPYSAHSHNIMRVCMWHEFESHSMDVVQGRAVRTMQRVPDHPEGEHISR